MAGKRYRLEIRKTKDSETLAWIGGSIETSLEIVRTEQEAEPFGKPSGFLGRAKKLVAASEEFRGHEVHMELIK